MNVLIETLRYSFGIEPGGEENDEDEPEAKRNAVFSMDYL